MITYQTKLISRFIQRMTAVLNIQRLLEAAEYIERRERGTFNEEITCQMPLYCILYCTLYLKGLGPWLMCGQRCDAFLMGYFFQSVNTDMPRPFRLFSTPATRDKENSVIKSTTTTTTGKHMMWLFSLLLHSEEKLLEQIQTARRVHRSHCYDICQSLSLENKRLNHCCCIF